MREPLESLLCAFGVTNLPSPLACVREWNDIDLLVRAGLTGSNIAMIEMKLDDHERQVSKWVGGEQKTGWQTEIYPQLCPGCQHHPFVTLGAGEYYHAP
jgi:hypothetical protein